MGGWNSGSSQRDPLARSYPSGSVGVNASFSHGPRPRHSNVDENRLRDTIVSLSTQLDEKTRILRVSGPLSM